MDRRPVPAAGVVCLRGDQVLLIRRGQPPRHGEWSLPGGRLEWGETAAGCALRELREEAGVEADLLDLLDVIDGFFPARGADEERHYLLIDYAARWRSGEPTAGDDASEARFVGVDEALSLVEWDETRRIIRLAIERFGE